MKLKPLLVLAAFSTCVSAFAQNSTGTQNSAEKSLTGSLAIPPGLDPFGYPGKRAIRTPEERQSLRNDIQRYRDTQDDRTAAYNRLRADTKSGNTSDAAAQKERIEADNRTLGSEKQRIEQDRRAIAEDQRKEQQERQREARERQQADERKEQQQEKDRHSSLEHKEQERHQAFERKERERREAWAQKERNERQRKHEGQE